MLQKKRTNRKTFAERQKTIAIEWRRKLSWSKGFLGLTGGKLCLGDLAYMGDMEDHCIPTVRMVVTQERKEKMREKEANTHSHRIAQNGCGETELVGFCLGARSMAKQVTPPTVTCPGSWSVTMPTHLLLVWSCQPDSPHHQTVLSGKRC